MYTIWPIQINNIARYSIGGKNIFNKIVNFFDKNIPDINIFILLPFKTKIIFTDEKNTGINC